MAMSGAHEENAYLHLKIEEYERRIESLSRAIEFLDLARSLKASTKDAFDYLEHSSRKMIESNIPKLR